MSLFRCLVSKTVTNQFTGVDLGAGTNTTYTLTNTPVVAGSLSGILVAEGVEVQSFTVDINGAFTFTPIGSPTTFATHGSINLGTGVISLTWNFAPGANYGIVTFTGLPVYKLVSMLKFGVNCPPPFNPLCNTYSNAYVPVVTVCDQALYT